MHRKPLTILLILCALVFANSLRNGFVGDDNFLILQNDFYSSWANVRDLFTSRYMTDSAQAISPADNARYFSGSVAYRPVLSLTYFWDHALWQENPLGYHLTSVLLHMANVGAVYFLVFLIGGQIGPAFLTALIFAVHPFKSEAVCAISYRAGMVASLFLLGAMLAYLRFKKVVLSRWAILAHTSFFLALFAKESAIVFPALVFVYDRLFTANTEKGGWLRRYAAPYSGYLGICAVYVYVYLFVFPNAQASSVSWLGGGLVTHVRTGFQILAEYLSGFFFPLFVHVVPPVYVPQMPAPENVMAAVMVLTVVFAVWMSVLFARRGKMNAFFISWFWLALVPVSNIIPLVNPMAHRFMYLPSIGIAFLLAKFIQVAGEWLNQKLKSHYFVPIVAGTYLITCGIAAVAINAAWRHDFIMAYQLYQKHPRDPISHLFMGLTYIRIGEPEKAERVILQGARLGLEDPRVYYALALSRKDDLDVAIAYLNKGVEAYPDYAMLYLGLGRCYLLQGDLVQARQSLRRSLALQSSYRAYNYLFQVLLMEGDMPAVEAVRDEITAVMQDPQYDAFLAHTMDIKDTLTLPEDNGF
ncbi:MAG: tetratricopeptide repeat protein [Candidatus Omnitrophica bacterium]|nr:tetratricopeptide repeat protein [Candidatus Omnitrophota bacterium]